MITSPIKSIVRNLTDKKYTTPITSRMRIVLDPAGTATDTARIDGDVFTLMDRTVVAEALVNDILANKVSLTYVVDKVATLITNTEAANINSSVTLRDAVYKANSSIKSVPSKKEVQPEPAPTEPVTPQPVEEVPTPTEPENVKPVETPVSATDNSENTESEATKDATTNTTKKEAASKPQKKARQIKIN